MDGILYYIYQSYTIDLEIVYGLTNYWKEEHIDGNFIVCLPIIRPRFINSL